MDTICGTALSVVFHLQVDVPRTSFFSLPRFLAEERTQQPTRQNPYCTHWQIARKMWERCVCFAVREHSQEILGRCGKKPLVCASLSYPISPSLIGVPHTTTRWQLTPLGYTLESHGRHPDGRRS